MHQIPRPGPPLTAPSTLSAVARLNLRDSRPLHPRKSRSSLLSSLLHKSSVPSGILIEVRRNAKHERRIPSPSLKLHQPLTRPCPRRNFTIAAYGQSTAPSMMALSSVRQRDPVPRPPAGFFHMHQLFAHPWSSSRKGPGIQHGKFAFSPLPNPQCIPVFRRHALFRLPEAQTVAPAVRILSPVDESQRVTLKGNTPPCQRITIGARSAPAFP